MRPTLLFVEQSEPSCLTQPQVDGVWRAYEFVIKCRIPEVVFVFIIEYVAMLIMSEWRLVGFGDPNAMRSTSAPAAPCGPSDGHHSAASHAPVAPEADLVPLLETSVTLGTNKSGGIIVLAAILHVTGPETRVTGPYSAVSEVAVARHLGAECLSAQTPTCGLQQRRVARVVAACDLELGAVDQPKSGRDHVFVVCGFRGLTDGGCSVVPIFTAVFHPVFIVVVGESGDESPALFYGCHVTVYLRWRYSHAYY